MLLLLLFLLFLVSVNLYGNETNNTTFSQGQSTEEPTVTNQYLIPKFIKIVQSPSTESNESVPFPRQTQIQLFDVFNRWCVHLGTDLAPWTLTASLVPGNGHPDAKLAGATTVNFINGTASFSDLQITHQGSGYKLKYYVSYPLDTAFEIEGTTLVEIEERELGFRFQSEIKDAVEMFPLEQQPMAYIYDVTTGKNVETLGARGRKWILEAELVGDKAVLVGETKVVFNESMAMFTDLGINKAGTAYQISLKVYTEPSSRYNSNKHLTSTFNVEERSYHLKVAQSISECNDTITCGKQPVIEIRSQDRIATQLNWDAREWHMTATLCQGDSINNPLKGTTKLPVNQSGIVQFTDLKFDNLGQNYKLCFKLVVTSAEEKFADISTQSEPFNIIGRRFYLKVHSQPGRIFYVVL